MLTYSTLLALFEWDCLDYRKSSIKPPGGAYSFQAPLRGGRGGLIERGGLKERGGGHISFSETHHL